MRTYKWEGAPVSQELKDLLSKATVLANSGFMHKDMKNIMLRVYEILDDDFKAARTLYELKRIADEQIMKANRIGGLIGEAGPEAIALTK